MARCSFGRLSMLLLFAVAAAMLSTSSSGAAEPGALQAAVEPLIAAHKGDVAAAIKHLPTGEVFLHRADEPMPTASLIKFPVMVEAYRQAKEGMVDLDQLISMREEDKVPGSGILTTHFSAGAQISLRDAIRLMIAYSDNTATNLVLDKIGLAATATTMEQFGFPHTKIHAKVFRRETSVFPERSQQFGLGSTTAGEMIRLYEMLHAGQLVDAEACARMKEHLLQCQDKSKLARSLPPGVEIAHKSGSVSAVKCDAGIIYGPSGAIVICVLTDKNQDRRWEDDNEAQVLCAKVARAAYDHFNPTATTTASPLAPQIVKIGASGKLVEDLQRTLNARLSPSPEISIDGEFGPQTQQAVVAFQSGRGLAASGEVDEKTWQALGPLVSGDAPVPAPSVVNAESLPLAAAEPLDGPPLTTCKAWVIADGRSGKALWSHQADDRLDFASTTKIMTAYLVLRLAAEDESVLAEQVVFSQRADDTPGSTAGVRAGERLSAGELLYGLLLPSGNDASVALAEHFGSRFAALGGDEDNSADGLARFVIEMNRAAAALGMQQTNYANPHGLTAQDHQSTARDLAVLAHAAMQMPRFRQYVGTRQRGAELIGAEGYSRNVVWKNTNQLLPMQGYVGVKTGTTQAAGACLVSYGVRGDQQLLVVVLGSASSEARYVDARNLFRWAWSQQAADSQSP